MAQEIGVQSEVKSYQRLKKKKKKRVLDESLLNTQHYMEWITGKWNNSGKGVIPLLHPSVVAMEKRAFRLPLTMVSQLLLLLYSIKFLPTQIIFKPIYLTYFLYQPMSYFVKLYK